MNKKTDAFFGFLMIYGWGIFVVLVAIGALAYFVSLSPGKFLPSTCGCYSTNYTTTINIFKINETSIYECGNIEQVIDYNNRTIDFIKTSELYICINKSMVVV